MKFLLLSLLVLSCSPRYTAITVDCYIDPDDCAQSIVNENPQYKNFKVTSVDTIKHKIKVRFYE